MMKNSFAWFCASVAVLACCFIHCYPTKAGIMIVTAQTLILLVAVMKPIPMTEEQLAHYLPPPAESNIQKSW